MLPFPLPPIPLRIAPSAQLGVYALSLHSPHVCVHVVGCVCVAPRIPTSSSICTKERAGSSTRLSTKYAPRFVGGRRASSLRALPVTRAATGTTCVSRLPRLASSSPCLQ
jgi:hypothetical protein